MIEDRVRGALLYSLAGAACLAGAVWFVRSEPVTGRDPRLTEWRETTERLLPDTPSQAMADTVVLTGAQGTENAGPVDGGAYSLSMICAGTGQVRVRLSTRGNDTGRAVRCSDEPAAERLPVALVDEFFIAVSAEVGEAGAVFRWRLERTGGF